MEDEPFQTRRPYKRIFPEIVHGIRRQFQPAPLPDIHVPVSDGRIERIGRILCQTLCRTLFFLQRMEIIQGAEMQRLLVKPGIQYLGQVRIDRTAFLTRLDKGGRRLRCDDMEPFFRTGQGDIEGIEIVHVLEQFLPREIFGEQGLGRLLGRQADPVGPVGDAFQRRPRQVRAAPACLVPVQSHGLGIREDDIGELQTLGLMDGQDPDGIRILRGTDLRVCIRPGFQEARQVVSMGCNPILQLIHKRLDIKDFSVE